jgi:arylsulfatase A
MNYKFITGFFPVLATITFSCSGKHEETAALPNVVLIFVDDMGYGDIGIQGAKGYHTPHIDRMAEQGARFTEFYVSQAVCSASRASLLTGCYAERVSIRGAMTPGHAFGLNPDEFTLGDLFKQRGYATAAYGKWHLGHLKPFLPQAQGFDEYFGIPYSNDMWPLHPEYPPESYPELPMIEGTEIVNSKVTPDDQKQFTTWFTERTVKFIRNNHDKPFFIYLAHPMPHVPLYVSSKFEGVSERGLYGDVIMELDWSLGEILRTLKELGLDEQTLVIFLSDNGPWLSYGDHAGSAGHLREGKGTAFEGGPRVPALMRWPGTIPAGMIVDELAMAFDLLPTFAGMLEVDITGNPVIDGRDIFTLMVEPGAPTPHEVIFHYHGGQLRAVRDPQFKLHFPRTYAMHPLERATGGQPVPYRRGSIGLELFDIKDDPGETMDVSDKYPEVVERLMQHADSIRIELGDRLPPNDLRGEAVRPHGWLW